MCNLFLRLAFKLHFAELIFAIDSSKLYQIDVFKAKCLGLRAKIAKISSAKNYSAAIYDCKNFCP